MIKYGISRDKINFIPDLGIWKGGVLFKYAFYFEWFGVWTLIGKKRLNK